jgi:hypothetical protein
MLALPDHRELRQSWQRAAELLLAQADVILVSQQIQLALFPRLQTSIWNASSSHYRRALEASKGERYDERRCERPADRAVGAECAGTGVFGEASSSSPCCPVAI